MIFKELRPITLADLLLSMKEHEKAKLYFSNDLVYYGEPHDNYPIWNLHFATLEEQSEECKEKVGQWKRSMR